MILRSILSYVYCEYHECNCKRREGDLKTFPIVRKLKSIEKPEKSILTRQKHFKEKQFHRLDRMLKSKTQEKRNQRWKTGGNEKSVFWLRWQFHGKYKSFAGSAVGLWFDFNKSERGELRVRLLRDEALAVWGKTSTRSPQVFAARLFPRLDIYSKFERGIQPGYLDWQPGQEIGKLTKLWTIRRRFVLLYFLMITSISRFCSKHSKINIIIKN